MRLNGVGFPGAVRFLADLSGVIPTAKESAIRLPIARKPVKPAIPPPEGPSGLPLDEAWTLVTEAADCLWTPEGRKALAYLRGRGLKDATIKAAGLGFTPGVMIPKRDGDRFRESGITIPWIEGDRLSKVNIRRREGSDPKYRQAFSDRPGIYPGRMRSGPTNR